jgi:hypothetical protein
MAFPRFTVRRLLGVMTMLALVMALPFVLAKLSSKGSRTKVLRGNQIGRQQYIEHNRHYRRVLAADRKNLPPGVYQREINRLDAIAVREGIVGEDK